MGGGGFSLTLCLDKELAGGTAGSLVSPPREEETWVGIIEHVLGRFALGFLHAGGAFLS